MAKISRVEVFVAVVNAKGFAAAGRQLGMSGAAVSKQIQNLEHELGLRLLNRSTRSVSLTDEGQVYFDGASRALSDLYETEQRLLELKDCPTGRLKINAPMSFGHLYLSGPIAKFAKTYPDVELEVNLDDRWIDVISEGYDVVVRIGTLQDSSLQARKLGDCPIWLCVSPECIKQHGEINSIEDVKDYPAVIYSRHGQSESWHYGNDHESGSVTLNKAFSANTAEVQLSACLAGVGLALLPAFAAANALRNGDLIHVLNHYETQPKRAIYALFAHGRAESARVRLFIDALVTASTQFSWVDAS